MNIKGYHFYFLLSLLAFLSASILSARDNNKNIFYHFSDYSSGKLEECLSDINANQRNYRISDESNQLSVKQTNQRLLTEDSLFVPDTVITQNWKDSAWVNKGRSDYFYGYKGKVSEEHSLSWTNNGWAIMFTVYKHFYDNDGDEIQYLVQGGVDDDTNKTNSFRLLTEYSSNKQYLTQTYQIWGMLQWDNKSRTEIKLKSKDDPVSITIGMDYKEDNYLDTTYRRVTNYNSNGRIVKEENFHYADTSYDKTEYKYILSQNADTVITYYYIYVDTVLMATNKDMSIYNKNGDLIKYVIYKVNKETNEWEEYTIFYWYFNGFGRLEKYEEKDYVSDKGWITGAIKYYYYDNNNNLIEEVHQDVNYNTDNALENRKRILYKYRKISSVEDLISLQDNRLDVYPNPAKEYIEIPGAENEKAEIFNSLGSLVISSPGSERIDISSLPAGVYYVKVRDRVRKIVKI